MRKFCAISGTALITASCFSNYFTREVHPIMEVKTEHLITLATSRSFFEWSDEEAKLLFLAIANSLQMLSVETPAIASPSASVVASSIENLIAIAGWHTYRNFPLPVFRISTENANSSMQAFPTLLTTVIASREETKESDRKALELVNLEAAIKVLFNKCSIGANKYKMLRETVARWAIKVTNEAAKKERVTPELQEVWLKLLQTSAAEAYKFLDVEKFGDVDIADLDDFMSSHLPHGCTASYEVMKHLTAIKNSTISLTDVLGIDATIKVINNASENCAAPIEANYSSKLEFLIARAKYLAQRTEVKDGSI